MPLLHRRSYTRSDFRRLALPSTYDASRLRGLDLRRAAFFESGYSPRPKPLPSSNFTLLQDFRSLDVGHRSHGGLPLYVTRSIFVARMHLVGGHVRQSPSRCRSSASSREDTGAILVQDSKRSRASFEHRITSRHTTSAVTAGAGLARLRGLVTFWVFRARRRLRPLTLR
jgi:hypothetical protein